MKCQRVVQTELPNGNITRKRCDKEAKYLIAVGGEINSYHACVEHANEMRRRIDSDIEPLNPKLIVMK